MKTKDFETNLRVKSRIRVVHEMMAEAVTVCVVVAVVVWGVASGWFALTVNDNDGRIASQNNTNLFWNAVAGNTKPNTATPEGRLAEDLRAHLESRPEKNTSENPLFDKGLAALYVTDDRYEGIEGRLYDDVFVDDGRAGDVDYGAFNDEFLTKVELADKGTLANVVVPVDIPDDARKFYWWWLPLFTGIASLLGFAIALGIWCTTPDKWTGRPAMSEVKWWRVEQPNLGSRLQFAILVPPVGIFAMAYAVLSGIAEAERRNQARNEQRRQEAAALVRRLQNPFSAEILEAETIRGRLVALPRTPTTLKAIEEADRVIEELVSAPEELSIQSADWFAQEALDNLALLAEKPRNVKKARTELNN